VRQISHDTGPYVNIIHVQQRCADSEILGPRPPGSKPKQSCGGVCVRTVSNSDNILEPCSANLVGGMCKKTANATGFLSTCIVTTP